jgi:hypothetical protein
MSICKWFCLCLLSLWPAMTTAERNQSGAAQASEKFVDGVVDSKNNTYILTPYGLKRMTPNGDSVMIERGVYSRSLFTSFAFQAVALDDQERPWILWTGKRENTIETYLTLAGTQTNVPLNKAVNFALSMSIAPNRDIYIFGVSYLQENAQLVHRFSSTGDYLGGFNPFMNSNPIDSSERHKFGRSRIIANKDGLFILSPLYDSRVIKWSKDRVESTFDYGTVSPDGFRRNPVTIFMRNGKLYLQVFVGGRRDQSHHDIYIYENGGFEFYLKTDKSWGQVLGMTTDDTLILRDVTITASRDSISPINP